MYFLFSIESSTIDFDHVGLTFKKRVLYEGPNVFDFISTPFTRDDDSS